MPRKEKEVKLLRRQNRSRAAYTLVDLSDLHPDLQKDIIADANEGAGAYGIRVVEESVNGPARAPIYGYYNDGPDAERWAAAKKELDIEGAEVADGDVYTSAGIEINDAAREAALREQAAARALAEAEAIRTAEDRDVSAITGDTDDQPAPTRIPPQTHHGNIIDEGLAEDATNEAADAENRTTEESRTGSDATGESATKKPTRNRSPR